MVQKRISAIAADSYLTTDVIDDFINEAVQQVNSEEDWPWLAVTTSFPTVVNQFSYSLTSIAGATWYRVHSVFDTVRGQGLEIRTIQEIDDLNYPASATSGSSPYNYTVFGDNLVLGPTPQDVRSLLLHWYQREPLLVGDLDQLLMPGNANWHYGIAEYAAYLCLKMVREDTRAEAAYAAYGRWLVRIRDEKQRTHSSLRVRVRPGGML